MDIFEIGKLYSKTELTQGAPQHRGNNPKKMVKPNQKKIIPDYHIMYLFKMIRRLLKVM